MNRTVALLRVKLQTMNEVFPADNVNLDVDEAHAIALYEPGGCGCSCFLGWRTACSSLHTNMSFLMDRYPQPCC